MICENCGYNMQDESDFCMNCGVKVGKKAINKIQIKTPDNLNDEVVCGKCGKSNSGTSVFCAECGKRLKKGINRKYIFGSIALVFLIALVVCLVIIQNNSLKSPIEKVSKKVYNQGQEYLEKMDSSNVKEAVAQYVKSNSDVKMNEIYEHIGGVDFTVETGKKATSEEIYYADLIDKFWRSKAICYAHQAIMEQYKDSDETSVQMAVTLYKGVVSDFEDSIDEAERILKKASTLEDMEEAYQILDDIWESED